MKISSFIKIFVILVLGILGLIFNSESQKAYAQCTTSSYRCCYGACASGWTTGGSTRCCGSQGGCSSTCVCNWSRCQVVSSPPPCGNCVYCQRLCSCWCRTCSPPPCPSGTSTTNTGSACYYGAIRANCGYSCNPTGCGSVSGCYSSRRSCWYVENNPAPSTPTNINMSYSASYGTVSCNLGTATRIPRITAASFLASGSVNNRSGDRIGNSPSLRYVYGLPDLGLQSGTLGTSTRWSVSSLNLTRGTTYRVSAYANSVNRCGGSRNSGTLTRTFKVNNLPRVISITPVGVNHNGGVSGNPSDTVHGMNSEFECNIDNPKTFRVVFEDVDGCGDISNTQSPAGPICGSTTTSELLFRAVRRGTSTTFGPSSVSPNPGSVSCSGSRVTADFTIRFSGEENVLLDLQARARDIFGETSGWVHPGPNAVWTYDGVRPSLELDPNTVVSADELNVKWKATDNIGTLSGIAGLRMSVKLEIGNNLTNPTDYGPVTYYYAGEGEGKVLDVNNPFNVYEEAFIQKFPPAEALGYPSYPLGHEVYASDLMNIGRNQDGGFDFKFEAVDRACNYASTERTLPLGSPWIATRGGFVHSGGEIKLDIMGSFYSNVINIENYDYIEPNVGVDGEKTNLTTELVTSDADSEIPGLKLDDGDDYLFYALPSYSKQLNRSWYGVFLSRANSQDPERTMWNDIEVPEGEIYSMSEAELSVCENSQYVYFVDGDLLIDPALHEDLALTGANGCIFVVSENLIIDEGLHKSTSDDLGAFSVGYDFVRGYFVVDGNIDIKFVDGDKSVRDGLKVIGGLFATGTDKDSSVILGRSLQLRRNIQYPTLIIFHDARYLDISKKLFGDTFGGGYIRDVGLKF